MNISTACIIQQPVIKQSQHVTDIVEGKQWRNAVQQCFTIETNQYCVYLKIKFTMTIPVRKSPSYDLITTNVQYSYQAANENLKQSKTGTYMVIS